MRRPSQIESSTAAPIATPGKTDVTERVEAIPIATVCNHRPQLGAGGGTPSRRNESAASAMIAPATPSVAAITTEQ